MVEKSQNFIDDIHTYKCYLFLLCGPPLLLMKWTSWGQTETILLLIHLGLLVVFPCCWTEQGCGQTQPRAEYLGRPGAMDLSAPRPRRRLTINIKSPFWMPSQVAGRGAYLLSRRRRVAEVKFQKENCGQMWGLAWSLSGGCKRAF